MFVSLKLTDAPDDSPSFATIDMPGVPRPGEAIAFSEQGRVGKIYQVVGSFWLASAKPDEPENYWATLVCKVREIKQIVT